MISILGAFAIVIYASAPASAANVMVLPARAYAMWIPNYCSVGDGYAVDPGPSGSYTSIVARTWSLKAIGPECDDPSPAPYNTFAALSLLEVYTGGNWSICGSLSHAVNPSNTSFVAAGRTIQNCGKNRTYHLRGEWRITYAGANQNDADDDYWYWSA